MYEILNRYVVEDGSLSKAEFNEMNGTVLYIIICPISSKHPSYWKPFSWLKRFFGGSIYTNGDGRKIKLVFKNCSEMKTQLFEESVYENEPDQVVRCELHNNESVSSFLLETEGAKSSFRFENLKVEEV